MRTAQQISMMLLILWGLAGQPNLAAGADLSTLAGTAFEEPLIATCPTSRAEDAALYRAIQTYRSQTAPDDFEVFEAFLAGHPHSGWRVALLANLGLSYYHYGYFSKAIAAWEQAWNSGRSLTEPRLKILVDRAVGELARMHARLGHADQLDALFRDIGERPISGPATESIQGAREARWLFRNQPDVSYLCGPMALRSLLLSQGVPYSRVEFLNAVRSGPRGVSIGEVARLAEQANLPHRLIFRPAGQPIPVPSIVHWKVTHFAAIVEEVDGRFHIQDPTFGSDLWITRRALESESSGYFLVPAATLAAGWRTVGAAEAGEVRGMGNTSSNDPGATTPCDTKVHQSDRGCGMTGYNVHEMVVSLNLNDTPVGYKPPRGPDMHVTLTFNQREANQPANFAWFNVSPKWTLNWLSYIQDDPTNARATVMRYVAGGGTVTYPFLTATSSYARETRDASLLVRTTTTPITYERRLADGGREVYSQSNGATTNPRRVFLTQVIDAVGNTVTLTYDNQMRLTTVTDAVKRMTKFSYELSGRPLLVTTITDPFGRSAKIGYDASGRLNQITDVLGLVSKLTYDSSGLVNAMTTPYATTTFAYAQEDGFFGLGTFRSVEITDPLGQKEKVEFRHYASLIFAGDPEKVVPTGNINIVNDYLWFRDTYYWDKHAYLPAPIPLYLRARAKHWLHLTSDQNVTGHIVESLKQPFENRVWFNYPGQPNPILSGTLDKISKAARVMDDGTTQLTQVDYNTLGHVTRKVDAVGRETTFLYDTNQIDVLQIQQKTASGPVTVATFTYNNQHRPLTIKDAAGQVTSFAYNSAGQVTQVTDALGGTTKYEYDSSGYLTRIVNANNQTAESRTYDAFGRIATRTDSEGFTVSYTYDDMDRVTRKTYPDGTTREYTWDKLDLVAVKDRQGRTTAYTYDVLRNLLSIVDPAGRTTTFDYYENGRLKSITDANGNTTSWDIDLQNRVTARHHADGSTVTTKYEDTTSRVKSVTDALGQVKQFSYTPDGLLAGIDYLKAVNPTPAVRFTYDPYFRRLVSMTDGAGTTRYEYQPAGSLGALKLAKEIGPSANSTIAWQYDALGRISGRTVGSSTENFTYDSLGRVTSHTSDLGAFDFTYVGQTGRVASRVLRGASLETNWNYDASLRQLQAIVNSGAARSHQYTMTPENTITQVTETAGADGAWPAQTWNFTYDTVDRLVQSASSGGAQYAYDYDAAGNILTAQSPRGAMNLGYDALNQVMTANDRQFIYDANGNLTDDGQRTYTWDADNRLLSVSPKAQPGRTTTFRYDGLGRRIAIVSADGVETRYQWCRQTLCQARDASDTVTRQYFAEGELTAAGGSIYARDQTRSVRDVFSAGDGSRIASYDFDPYGNLVQSDGHGATDFRFAGMFYNQETGLYLTRYRVYDPLTARWLSRDPLGQLGGINQYAYAEPNPINYIDPSGALSFGSQEVKEWLAEQAGSNVAETGISNTLKQVLPDGAADFVAAGSVGVLEAIAASDGAILACPECLAGIFVETGALSVVKDESLKYLLEQGIDLWRNFKDWLSCQNPSFSGGSNSNLGITPIVPLSPWFLNPTYQDDTAIDPDISLASYDPGVDDNIYSPDRPFVIYFLGPWFSPLRLSFAPGSFR